MATATETARTAKDTRHERTSNQHGAAPYAFPAMAKLDESQCWPTGRARQAQLEAVLNDAIARGHRSEGSRARPPRSAGRSWQLLLEQSRRERPSQARPRRDGLDEMRQAASALREALAEFEVQRTQIIVSEAEAFFASILPSRSSRAWSQTDSVRSGIRSALGEVRPQAALAPENPTAIFLNPKVAKRRSGAQDRRPTAARRRKSVDRQCTRVEAGRLLVESSIDEVF